MSGDAVVLLLEALFLANAVFFLVLWSFFLRLYIGFFWIFFKWLLLQRLASVVSVFVSGS